MMIMSFIISPVQLSPPGVVPRLAHFTSHISGCNGNIKISPHLTPKYQAFEYEGAALALASPGHNEVDNVGMTASSSQPCQGSGGQSVTSEPARHGQP